MASKPKNEKTTAPIEKPASKQDQVLALLRRQQGATIQEICEVTGWRQHSARGFLSGALKKRLKIDVVSEKDEAGERRYALLKLDLSDGPPRDVPPTDLPQ